MKTILILLIAVLSPFFAHAQGVPVKPVAPKRPLGVPADAKPFNGRWYKVVLEKKSWHAARDKCKEMGGQLVTIPDAATWEFVKGLTTAFAWLGATDEVAEGAWLWVDGTPVTQNVWGPGQPDNGHQAEHYMIMINRVALDGPKETRPPAFICEWVK